MVDAWLNTYSSSNNHILLSLSKVNDKRDDFNFEIVYFPFYMLTFLLDIYFAAFFVLREYVVHVILVTTQKNILTATLM